MSAGSCWSYESYWKFRRALLARPDEGVRAYVSCLCFPACGLGLFRRGSGSLRCGYSGGAACRLFSSTQASRTLNNNWMSSRRIAGSCWTWAFIICARSME